MGYQKDVIVEILLRLEQRVDKLSRQFFILYLVILIGLMVSLCWLTSIEVRIKDKKEAINIQQYINANKQNCNTNLKSNKREDYKDTSINLEGMFGNERRK